MSSGVKGHVGVCYVDEADKVVAAAIPRGEVAAGSWQVVTFGDEPYSADVNMLAEAACEMMNELVRMTVHNCLVCGGTMRNEARGYVAIDSSDGEHSMSMPRTMVFHEQPQCVAWLRAETRIKCVSADAEAGVARVS